MLVSKITQNQNTSFKGKFIQISHFNYAEKKLIKDFINYSYKGKTNASILKKKAYDIYFLKENNNIVLNTLFRQKHSNELEPCFISFLKDDLENSTAQFRNSLDWYRHFKKEHGYFNSFWERLRTYF